MPWGEPHSMGTGTSQEVLEAHQALDSINVPSGSLAVRTVEAVNRIKKVRLIAMKALEEEEEDNPT